MNILIIGGSGFIGRHLSKALLARKDRVAILSRAKRISDQAQANYELIQWNGHDLEKALAGRDFDTVINLAGETIGKWPWSSAHKAKVLSSRTQTTAQVARYLATRSQPCIYLQSSGVGYYGNVPTNAMDETQPQGSGFLAKVAVDWEQAAKPITQMDHVRACFMRTGIVLSERGGALPMIALPVILFAGGRLGNGKQGMPWIHLEDAIGGFLHCLDNTNTEGVYNLCSPNPVSNAEIMNKLGGATKRPIWLPVPAFALQLMLGEMSSLLLEGQYALPKRLLADGYTFKFPRLEEALENIYGKN